MKHDIFEFTSDMTWAQRAWRLAFMATIAAVVLMDLLVWRPL